MTTASTKPSTAVSHVSIHGHLRFLAHHARALLDLRRAHQHLEQSLEAIDYADQKVLNEFVSVSTFLNQTDTRAAAVVRFAASSIRRGGHALGMEALQNALSADDQNLHLASCLTGETGLSRSSVSPSRSPE